jgi:hypothetical protein
VFKLCFLIRIVPRIVAVLFCDAKKRWKERAAYVLGEGEVFVPVAGVQVIVENAADATGTVSVGDVEVFVGPFFKPWIVGRVVLVAVLFERVVEESSILIALDTRVQVRTTAEP